MATVTIPVISIGDLLRYKRKVDLKSNNVTLGTVWLRILGDYDLQLSYRIARIASAKKRAALRTPGTLDYEDDIAPIPTLNTRQECINLIKSSKLNGFVSEAYANIDREEPVQAEDVAKEPDAPTLEEQEQIDIKQAELDESYQLKIRQYMEEHLTALDAELATKSDEEIFIDTQFEMSNILALAEFQAEVQAQKIFRATYNDEKCKVRTFVDMDEYRNTHSTIKDQLIAAYEQLEVSPEDIKN